MKLTGDVQELGDGEIYFVVAKGISHTAMPAFEKTHSPQDIWRAVLWVRHLANLTPAERQEIESRMHETAHEHERTMEHGANQPSENEK